MKFRLALTTLFVLGGSGVQAAAGDPWSLDDEVAVARDLLSQRTRSLSVQELGRERAAAALDERDVAGNTA